MAHNLASTNGRTAMAYYGDTPWHGSGTKLMEPATAAEAMRAAGLDYEVKLVALQTIDGQAVTQRKAVVRADTERVLDVVGNPCSYMHLCHNNATNVFRSFSSESRRKTFIPWSDVLFVR